MLRRLLDQLEPMFGKGGKLEVLHPLYEAGDTFLYTPPDVTRAASHVRDALDLKRLMTVVVVALIPCFFMAAWNTGYQANLALQQLGQASAEGWRGAVINGLGIGYSAHNPILSLIHI